MPRKKSEQRFISPKAGVFVEFGPGEYNIEEDEEEESDIQFLDYREISGMGEGKSFVKSQRSKRQRGWLVNPLVANTPSGKDKVQVCAPFHLSDPWWRIKMLRTAAGANHTVYIKDMFALCYELRHDPNMKRQKVVTMFLTKDSIPEEQIHKHIEEFENFVRQIGEEGNLNFDNLEDLLSRFEESLSSGDTTPARELKSKFHSKAGRLIGLARKFPKIFEYIPQLLPNQFMTILQIDEETIEELDSDIEERPWMFGFKQALYADRNLIGCEAPWIAFIRAGLREKIKQPYKDALIIYDYLKDDSRENGHTYIELSRLKTAMGSNVKNFEAGLKFLKTKKVVKEKLIYGKFCIFLYGLYKCEENITKGIKKLFQQPVGSAGPLQVNLESEAFSSIRSDREQLRAAEMIKQFPVVVISGKGGCGKTTVVTKVLSYCGFKERNDEDPELEPDLNFNDDQNLPTIESATNASDEKCPDMETKNDTGGQNADVKDIGLGHTCSRTDVLYTAPTGKAANLLGKRADATGYTLHQIIWSYRKYVSDLKGNPDLLWTFRDKDTLVVDECSLVSVTTFSTLLKILMENSELCRVVLLGDVRQLPSIEPGNFLSDVFQSMITKGCAIELKTNHRAESQLIVDNATRISQREYPIFDPNQNFKFHRVPDDQQADFTDTVVHKMLRSETILSSDKTSQFVAFKRKDCQWINAAACIHYNKHPLQDDKKKLFFKVGDKVCMTKNGQVRLFVKGRAGGITPIKVKQKEDKEEDESNLDTTSVGATQYQTQVPRRGANQDQRHRHQSSPDGLNESVLEDGQSDKDKEKETFKAMRLCNGEIFFIIDDQTVLNPTGKRKTIRYLQLTDYDKDDPKDILVDYQELMKECSMRHSWARTIHTFQGSESEAVIYVVGAVHNNGRQNWQHVYTAVTRGRKAVHIVGRDMDFVRALKKPEDKRNTGLKFFLINMLPKREDLNQSFNTTDVSVILSQTLDTSHNVADTSIVNFTETESNSNSQVHRQDSENFTPSFVNSEISQNSQNVPHCSKNYPSTSGDHPTMNPTTNSLAAKNQSQSDSSEEFMTSFVHSQEINGAVNLNFTKLKKKGRPGMTPAVQVDETRKTARNMFSGLMFPDGDLSNYWSSKSANGKSFTNMAMSSTPVVDRAKPSTSTDSNYNAPSPEIFDPASPQIAANRSSCNATTVSVSLGNDSQWSEVDEELLVELDDLDSDGATGDIEDEVYGGSGANSFPPLVSQTTSVSDSFDDSNANDDLDAACYLLEQSQLKKANQTDSGVSNSDSTFRHLKTTPERTQYYRTQNLFSPTKRHMTTDDLMVPTTPKKQKSSVLDLTVSVSPARNLLNKLDISDF